MANELTDVAQLEAAVGARTEAGTYKSIPILDPHCVAMLELSPLVVLGHVAPNGSLDTVLVGGEKGHAVAVSPTELALPSLDAGVLDAGSLVDDAPAGLLAFVPGYGETLRVNGRLSLSGDVPVLVVEEAFVHCAKALIRSKLWTADPADSAAWADAGEMRGGAELLEDPAVAAFLAASPFLTLASVDGAGKADVSPKGDPPGFVGVLGEGRLAVPDRPGNLRTDTLHNLLDRPELSLLAMVPGSDFVLRVSGRAATTDDEQIRASLEVNGKVPLAAVVIDSTSVVFGPDPAVGASTLWDRSQHVPAGTLPRASQIWSDHVQIHAGLSVDDEEQRLVPVDPMHDGIQQNYRDGLY